MSSTEHAIQKMTGGRKAEIRVGQKDCKRPGASWPYNVTGGKPARRPLVTAIALCLILSVEKRKREKEKAIYPY
jgi:hypothetical protein